ncbi:hypothetical protein ATCVOR07043_214L [Acanthocystis turfacea Chlorella virus OR0704.3]|nr:hypothetical protein ATCVOR07043_214L [Acanthocystis turfacea Chlorella virus OR0704.3]
MTWHCHLSFVVCVCHSTPSQLVYKSLPLECFLHQPSTTSFAKQANSQHPTMAINYSALAFDFPRREKIHPGMFSYYKRVFKGTVWRPFLLPNASLQGALDEGHRHNVNGDILSVPAVYEFAIAKHIGGKRFKTYLGTTRNAKQRHTKYLYNGDHIAQFLESAVKNGFVVYRRIRYIIPRANLNTRDMELAAVLAEQTETRLLGKYNYSWNARTNGGAAMTRMPVKTSFLCMFSKVKWLRNPDAKKFM